MPGLASAENLIHLFQNTELPEQHLILAGYTETLGFVAFFSKNLTIHIKSEHRKQDAPLQDNSFLNSLRLHNG